jgi:hypothetical protein
MRCVPLAAVVFVAGTMADGMAQSPPRRPPVKIPDLIVQPAPAAQRFCPKDPAPSIVEIREANPDRDRRHHERMVQLLTEKARTPNTTILLGPDVVLDFSKAPLPILFAACVTLTSTSTFGPDAASMPARTPRSPGPLLRFGPHRSDQDRVFLSIQCNSETNDHVRISGFRLHGPSFGQQSTEETGIEVFRCLDIEVSNMEIAGWGGSGIQVLDDDTGPADGPGQSPPANRPGERMGRPDQIRIFRNHIHHNQHPREGVFNSFAAGYGVVVDNGAWARIYENVFDFNRHAIAAAGDAGGYEAFRNLVLKGGGDHFAGFNTHQFDVHGTGDNGFGDQAGVRFDFAHNAFQYVEGPAIKIRGRPKRHASIHDSVFAHEGLEHDKGDDAIHLDDRDFKHIKLGPNNVVNVDSYGKYGVCDFDGDRIDDLFLATGKTWWFSSFGELPWSYLSDRTERLDQVRLGYFDDDLLCDVLTQSGRDWVIASGGTGPWRSIGRFGAPLDQVAFGRFDPNVRDHRPGRTRRTTHAFRRMPDGQWRVTPLSARAWEQAQGSGFPMSDLRFGDFTGDGVTDVLAVQGGRWSISKSARSPWQSLNRSLSDPVGSLHIADLNHNNIDDLIRLEVRTTGLNSAKEAFLWWVSEDGRKAWRELKGYVFPRRHGRTLPFAAFAGRFGAAPGGGVLLIDRTRLGHFFSEAELKTGTSPDWTSAFAY